MVEKYDAIVAGLGAMGSASLYQLARRQVRVLGIDRFSPPHTLGSTHGDTRITRQAIGEGDHFVPLTLRSYEIFREIENETGMDLLSITGGLMISSGSRTSTIHVAEFFENTLAAANKYGISHEVLNPAEMRRRFPQFLVQDNEIGYFEHEAGFLRPENCVEAQLRLARKLGASVSTGEQVLEFSKVEGGVLVHTDRGDYLTGSLVLTAGPWLPGLLGRHGSSLFKVYRQVLYWFDVETHYDQFVPERFPIFIWEVQGKGMAMYGFPAIDGPGGGLKIGSGRYLESIDPDNVIRDVSQQEIQSMYEMQVEPYFPLLGRDCVRTATCMYTATADARFVIDRHPEMEGVLVCSPCSGHGFKHSAAIGESLAELVTEGRSRIDLSPFSFESAMAHCW
ncbi:MAG: N-methyl-L-tryptophan oxidase [Candidatus Obscuribacterales bacterium]